MNYNILFILLVFGIVVTILGSIILFSYLGISLDNNNKFILRRKAIVTVENNELTTQIIK